MKRTRKEPLVSVIVPVYNVEKYLSRCIDSILNQTYRNIEVILVDDGSTDGSGEICDEYARKDKRICTIHQKNCGVSESRNVGLRETKGKWIVFIDSDDWVDEKYIKRLLDEAKMRDADIVQCQQIMVGETNRKITANNVNSGKVEIMSGCEACKRMLYQTDVTSALWGKIIRVNLFKGLKFKEGIIHEDLQMLYELFKKSKKVVIIDHLLYYYFERNNSLMRASFSERTLDILEILDSIISDTNDNELQLAAISRKVNADFFVLRQLPGSYKELRKLLKAEIKRYRGELLKNPEVRKKTKIALRLSYFGMPIVKLAFAIGGHMKTVRRIN